MSNLGETAEILEACKAIRRATEDHIEALKAQPPSPDRSERIQQAEVGLHLCTFVEESWAAVIEAEAEVERWRSHSRKGWALLRQSRKELHEIRREAAVGAS